MSRVGSSPVKILPGVTVSIKEAEVSVKGKLGELAYTLPPGINAEMKGDTVVISRVDDSRQSRSFHGLARSLVNNMVVGVATGYTKSLDIEGVGFKAELNGQTLMLSLGFPDAKAYAIPDGAKVTVQNQGVRMLVESANKQLAGRVAADIRSYFPAEPYKGKGIRYTDEQVRRKEGKTVV